MKIELFCLECHRVGRPTPVWLPFNNDSLYHFTCPEGHENTIRSQAAKFQDLAEVAVQALADGYYRDAVTSFNASLELFFQFYCRVVAAKRKLPDSVVDEAWKPVAAQSERQFGMFQAFHLLEMQAAAPQLPSSHVKFRNKVVHQGYLPSEAEALNFGQTLVDYIRPLISQFFTDEYLPAMGAVSTRSAREAWEKTKVTEAAFNTGAHVIKIVPHELPALTLADAVKDRRERRSLWRSINRAGYKPAAGI